jgi:hypothetical protein
LLERERERERERESERERERKRERKQLQWRNSDFRVAAAGSAALIATFGIASGGGGME